MNYTKWQLYCTMSTRILLLQHFQMMKLKKVHKIGFPVAETVSQACAQAVEKIMPFAVARPFVEEFVTAKVVDQVNN